MTAKIILVLVTFVSVVATSYATEGTEFDRGKRNFLVGKFKESTQFLLKPDVIIGDDSLKAQVYLVAMSEKKVVVRDELSEFIARQADKDIIYKILSARLRLQEGETDALEEIETLGMKHPYASYTLGLYHYGVFGVGEANEVEALAMFQFSGTRGFLRGKEWFNSLNKRLDSISQPQADSSEPSLPVPLRTASGLLDDATSSSS